MRRPLKARQKLGKYRLVRRLGEGGFADVYQAADTVEGVQVALKIPHASLVDRKLVDEFRKEVRLTARLDHPNILPIKNATFIDDYFVIAYPLGESTLADRLRHRLSVRTVLNYTEQLLEGLAYAHRHRIIHCDIKPENLILFAEDRLRLADFGIARVALRTLSASGSGTVGYMAPEQAMGRPSPRSDVFAVGLIIYRMLAGELPEWPYQWPFRKHQKIRSKLDAAALDFLRRSLEVDPMRRFENADRMLSAFRSVREGLRLDGMGRAPARPGTRGRRSQVWYEIVRGDLLHRHGKELSLEGECPACHGPVGEPMIHCSWCRERLRVYLGRTRFPRRCPRCRRGMKPDWKYCAWCYGPAIEEDRSERSYGDARYTGRCRAPGCPRRLLMPFMRYCPWCRARVRRRWAISGTSSRCDRCGWGVLQGLWRYCPWCAAGVSGQ